MPVPVLVSTVHEGALACPRVATAPLLIDQSFTLHSAGETPCPEGDLPARQREGGDLAGLRQGLARSDEGGCGRGRAREHEPTKDHGGKGANAARPTVLLSHVTERSSNR